MFSQTVEYALRAMVSLAAQPDHPMITREIAALTHAPPGYLSKVLQSLIRGQLLTARPGLRGGYLLSKDPARIRLLDVIEAVEPLRRITVCPLNLKAHGGALCPLHRRLDDAIAHIRGAFADTTLADLVAEAPRTGTLCKRARPA